MGDYSWELKKALKEAGCWLARQGKGDHEVWYSVHITLVVPVAAPISQSAVVADLINTPLLNAFLRTNHIRLARPRCKKFCKRIFFGKPILHKLPRPK